MKVWIEDEDQWNQNEPGIMCPCWRLPPALHLHLLTMPDDIRAKCESEREKGENQQTASIVSLPDKIGR